MVLLHAGWACNSLRRMEAAVQLLSIVGLALGTADYALLIRRRAADRRRLETVQKTGLQGLVRVMLADSA